MRPPRATRRTFLRRLAAGAAGGVALRGAPLSSVLLIGDSISIGYTPHVKRLLAERAAVSRIPVNGESTLTSLQNLAAWLGSERWDLIHFNWGLHDIKLDERGRHQVPLEQYEQNLRMLVDRLKAAGGRLIWASTTPVPAVPIEKLNPRRDSRDVPLYNAAARKIMEANGIAINDLYAFALPRLADMQQPANVHYTEAGYEALGQEVARVIGTALGRS